MHVPIHVWASLRAAKSLRATPSGIIRARATNFVGWPGRWPPAILTTVFDLRDHRPLPFPELRGGFTGQTSIFFLFYLKNNRARTMMKNKWPKSEEKRGVGGTLGLEETQGDE